MGEQVERIRERWISRSQAKRRFAMDDAYSFLDDMKLLLDTIDAETARADKAEAACAVYAKALGEALSLARTPEHAQDEAWYAEFDRLVALEKQSHPGQRYLDLAQIVEGLPKLTTQEWIILRSPLVNELGWTKEEADALAALLKYQQGMK